MDFPTTYEPAQTAASARWTRDGALSGQLLVDTGYVAFHPTSPVGQRNCVRASECPRRMFEDTKVNVKASGTRHNRARVFDSTPIYDAAAAQDTVAQLRR